MSHSNDIARGKPDTVKWPIERLCEMQHRDRRDCRMAATKCNARADMTLKHVENALKEKFRLTLELSQLVTSVMLSR